MIVKRRMSHMWLCPCNGCGPCVTFSFFCVSMFSPKSCRVGQASAFVSGRLASVITQVALWVSQSAALTPQKCRFIVAKCHLAVSEKCVTDGSDCTCRYVLCLLTTKTADGVAANTQRDSSPASFFMLLSGTNVCGSARIRLLFVSMTWHGKVVWGIRNVTFPRHADACAVAQNVRH